MQQNAQNSIIAQIIKNDFEGVLKSYPTDRLTDIITATLESEVTNPRFADYTDERKADTVKILTALQNLCLTLQDVEILPLKTV